MDLKTFTLLFLILTPVFVDCWRARDRRRRDPQKEVHYLSKRHMQSTEELKKRDAPSKPREFRKKPSGNLAPLEEDDIGNEEVISVAVGPPPIRNLQKANAKLPKLPPRPKLNPPEVQTTDIIKNILQELGRQFVTHQVKEEFVFGQYIGNSMKNLTSELKLKMQHEVLDLIVKYQRLNLGEHPDEVTNKLGGGMVKSNITNVEDTWPDFTNLAKIVD